MIDPHAIFHHPRYLRSTFRRLEHLEALGLPVESRTVLEVGAGIGDLTSFFLDRGCVVTSVEPREGNVEIFRERYSRDAVPEGRLRIVRSAIDELAQNGIEPHDVVVCQQVLNFTSEPESAIAILASYANGLLLLEAACDSGEGRDGEDIRVQDYDRDDPGGSITGVAHLPTRRWLFNRLERHFPYVYVALLQAQLDRFRLYWGRPDRARGHDRVLFLASRSPLDNPLFVDFVPTVQFRRLPGATDVLLPEGMRFARTVFGAMVTVRDDRSALQGRDEFDAVLRFLEDGDVVYDLGAGIGMHAVAFGIAVGERGIVVASEARELYEQALERNLRSHGIRNVRCERVKDVVAGRVALLRVDAEGMSDADWSTAGSIVERDRPVVCAPDPRKLDPALARFGYTRHANVYVPKGKRGLA